MQLRNVIYLGEQARSSFLGLLLAGRELGSVALSGWELGPGVSSGWELGPGAVLAQGMSLLRWSGAKWEGSGWGLLALV